MRRRAAGWLLAAGVLPAPALGHAIAGDRVFPVTQTFDDPGMADEASVPTLSWQRQPSGNGQGAADQYNLGLEYDKRVTEDFGVVINWGAAALQVPHGPAQAGFQNLFVTLKDQLYVDAEHELLVSVGVQRELSHIGTTGVGADRFGSTTPLVYFGKGLGDLPWDVARPFAITGELGYSFADVGLKSVGPGMQGNGNRWAGGLSVQYSLPYLQAQVRDLGLGPVLGGMIPLVEFTWSAPVTAPADVGPTYQLAPGVIWMGPRWQFALEALIPLNRAAGTKVGVIAQFHVFLDDLLPDSLGRPLVEW